MTRLLLTATLGLSLVAAVACKKDEAKAPVAEAHKPPMNAPPPAGSDGDKKRIEALDLAVKIDAALPGYQRAEKPLPALDGKTRKAEAWVENSTPPKPKKIVVTASDDKGGVETTDLYYDDRGMLQFARAPDGLFVFQLESLALWLDRSQNVKRGLSPSLTKTRVDAIMADNRASLLLFGLR